MRVWWIEKCRQHAMRRCQKLDRNYVNAPNNHLIKPIDYTADLIDGTLDRKPVQIRVQRKFNGNTTHEFVYTQDPRGEFQLGTLPGGTVATVL